VGCLITTRRSSSRTTATDIDQDAIEDGTAVVWPLSDDAKMVRSPERQYCGNYLTYGDKGAATYRHNADTHALIASYGSGHRDMTSNLPLVKTKAKAQARGDRQLLDVQRSGRPDHDAHRGHRVDARHPREGRHAAADQGTHWGADVRRLALRADRDRAAAPHSKGDLYDIDLELVMGMPVESSLSPGPLPPPFAGAMFAGLQRSRGELHRPAGTAQVREHVRHRRRRLVHAHDTRARSRSCPASRTPRQTASSTTRSKYRNDGRAYPCARGGHRRLHPDSTATMNVRVNGSLIGTQTAVLSGPAAGTSLEVDIRAYHLAAGDIVSVDSAGSGLSDTIFWTNSGVNDTYLHVARGTIYDNGGTNLITVGP
jgi:hypothetical protein